MSNIILTILFLSMSLLFAIPHEVLMQSRKPIAKQFKKMVKEILKKIRKTGSYSATPQVPNTFKEALMLAMYQQDRCTKYR